MKLFFSFFLLLILTIFNLDIKDPTPLPEACENENIKDSDRNCSGKTAFYQDY